MANRYWVAGGDGNWSNTNNWSSSSGGASGASVPGTADAAIFDASSGSGTATVDSNVEIQTLTMTGFTGTLAFGTNKISLNSTGTVYTGATTFSVTGTPVIDVITTGSTNTGVAPGSVTESNAISFNFTGGTYGASITGNSKNVNFTGFSGSLTNETRTIYGNLTISTGMTLNSGIAVTTFAATSGTQDITSNGKTFDFPLTFNGAGGTFRLQDALTMGSTRTLSFSAGTLNINNKTLTVGLFSSNVSTTRTLAFGTGSIAVSGTGLAWNTATITNLTVTGTPVTNFTSTASAPTSVEVRTGNISEANSITFNFTSGSYDLTFTQLTNSYVRTLDFTGFAGSLYLLASVRVYKDFKLSSGMTFSSGGANLEFRGTGVTQTITSNGKTIQNSVDFNGAGSTYVLADALSVASTITLFQGTLDLTAAGCTCAAFATNSGNNLTMAISFGSNYITVTGNNTTVLNMVLGAFSTFSYTGTFRVDSTYTGGVGTRIFAGALVNTNSYLNIGVSGAQVNFGSSATDSISVTGSWGNIDFTGFSQTLANALRSVFGNFTISSGMTLSSGTNATTFSATSGTQDITSSGKTFDFPVTFNGSGGTFRLQDALTVGSTRTVTLSAGTLNLNNLTLTTGAFATSTSTQKIISFGSGSITVTSSGNAWITTVANFSATGFPVVNVTNSTATATTVSPGGSTNAIISFNFTAGTYSLTFLGTLGQLARDVDFSGFSGTWLATNSVSIYGNLTISSGMSLTSSTGTMTFAGDFSTQTIISSGKTLDFPLTFSAASGNFVLSGALTVGSTRGVVLTTGALNLSSGSLSCGTFSSTGSGVRSIAFGSNSITLAGNAATVLNIGGANFSYTGTFNIASSYTGGTGTRTFSAGLIAAGTYPTLAVSGAQVNIGSTATDIVSLTGSWGDVDFTGFSRTLANAARSLFGNLTISTGMTLTAGTSITTFAATSGTKDITSNGKTFDFPITINGSGGTFRLQDALTMGSTRAFSHTNGTLNLNGQTLTVGSYSTGAGTKNLTFNGGTLVCPAATATSFNNASPANFTTTAGTGTGKISMTAATAKTFVGGGATYNCTLSNDGAGTLTVTGSNTFTTIANGVQPTAFSFTAGTTTTITNWNVSGTAGNLVTIGSVTASSHTLSKSFGVVSSNYLSISRSTATGSATWYAGANSTDGGNNSGWIFANAVFPKYFGWIIT